MQKLLSLLFLLSCSVSIQVAVLMLGWGLHPVSWKWIIGAGIFVPTFIKTFSERIEKEK